MACVARDGRGRRILFVAPDGRRRTIRLGRVPQRDAESIPRHVEHLLAAKVAGVPIPQATAVWLAGVGDVLRDKLAWAGLLDVTPGTTLAEAVRAYLERQRSATKPASLCATEHALRNLVDYFGADCRPASITSGQADDFVR